MKNDLKGYSANYLFVFFFYGLSKLEQANLGLAKFNFVLINLIIE